VFVTVRLRVSPSCRALAYIRSCDIHSFSTERSHQKQVRDSTSSQLFRGAQNLFSSFAMSKIKKSNHSRDDATFPVEDWGRADT